MYRLQKKRLTACLLAVAMVGAAAGGIVPASAQSGALPAINVDMSAQGHDILHGSAGFLYGISNEGVPDVNTLTPLKPKVLATKGALGTEHPYGDALDVAEEFFEAGGEQVQMYNSNYYGVFGVTADANDYGGVLKNTIAPSIVAWKNTMRAKFPDIDSKMVYIPINERSPITVNGTRSFERAWKIYYDSIKAADPNAKIAGPNDASYNSSNMRTFLSFCAEQGCLPDVVTWHELQVPCLESMQYHVADYRQICADLNIEEKQVVINEYADYADCGVPGRLVNWIARLEDQQLYGCLPFWHQANNLNDLAASANEGNGAWWVYKWYGDMSGQTLPVTTENTTYDGFYGLAAMDTQKKSAAVLCGGVDGSAKVNLNNILDTVVFGDADAAHVKVEASYFTGYHGAAVDTETVLEGDFDITGGNLSLQLDDMLFSTAYYITITTSDAAAPVKVGKYSARYEAEEALQHGTLSIDNQNSPIERPPYFCSGGQRVGGIDMEGDGIEYIVDIPFDGLYKLSFIYGNGVGSTRNNSATHAPLNITQKLVIDGSEDVLLLPNTLFYSMEGMVERYVNLTRGSHSIALMYNGDAGAYHDALYVSHSGAYAQEKPAFSARYEAEEADFNMLGQNTEKAVTESDFPGYSGSGYVTGLNTSQTASGGGIRWSVVLEESGLYHLNYRYRAPQEAGQLRICLDNTNLTFTNSLTNVDIARTNEWSGAYTSVYLRKGINIIDIDATCEADVDYMQVIRAAEDLSVTVEAESAAGSFETAVSGALTYVKPMLGSSAARSTPGQYFEISVNAPEDGVYKMQVFSSNNDLCGTHSYNIKIIDRYATIEVNGDAENAKRYFFPNSFSDDTFLEKSVPIQLKQGANTVRVYNDDSWKALWGGSTSEPGTNVLVNYTPNFDKFIFTPAVARIPLRDAGYMLDISSGGNGYIYADKNSVYAGDTVNIYMIPDGGVEKLTVNGRDITSTVTTGDGTLYQAAVEISGDTAVYAEFSGAIEGDYTPVSEAETGYVVIDGEKYAFNSGNLFKNGDFSDNSGANMEHWYVGTNSSGHPISGSSYRIPKINADGSVENMTPLTQSGYLTTGAYEVDNADTFYYGYDGREKYLVEHMSSNWQNCAWNGRHSLLAFVPIKENTKYYFKFRTVSVNGQGSIRFGAIDMDEGDNFYVPSQYSTGDGLNFRGTGYTNCTNGDMQNMGGAWSDHASIIDSGSGADYLLFNAYWLQMAEYLCFGSFELYELSEESAVYITQIESPDTVFTLLGDELTLAQSVRAEDEFGAEHTLSIEWLNASGVDTNTAGVYNVTGYVRLEENMCCDISLYVKQRVVVTDAPPLTLETARTDNAVSFALSKEDIFAYDVYTAVYNEKGVLERVFKNALTGSVDTIANQSYTLTVMLWKKNTIIPAALPVIRRR